MNLLDLQKISTRDLTTDKCYFKGCFLDVFRVKANPYMNTIPNTNLYKTLVLILIKLLY